MPSQNARKRKAQKKAAATKSHQHQPPKHKQTADTNSNNEIETELVSEATSDQLFPSSEAANNLDFIQNGTKVSETELNLETLKIGDTDILETENEVLEAHSDPTQDPSAGTAPESDLDPSGDVHISDDEEKAVKSKLPLESERGVSGVLISHPESRDLHLSQVTISSHGSELLSDAKVELNYGQRYGLVGLNGSGKTTLLQAIAAREVPIPDHFDIYLHQEEAESCHKSALHLVVEVEEEVTRIQEEVAMLSGTSGAGEDESVVDRLSELYDRLEELDASTAETRAAEILYGLGFTRKMMDKPSKDFSGGWRMRIALAKALFVKPQILLLDEPTNHLDLCACVWLEEELKKYKRILVLVSHSQDFLNGVCTNIIHLAKRGLFYYGGNYDAYVRTRAELEEHQMKRHNWQQGQIKHMKDYVARFGHGSAKLARQAQSKEKVLAKMVAGGLTERVVSDKIVHFSFPDCGSLPPPVVMVQNVSFRYAEDQPWIYRDLDFGIDLETRVALVGPNGVGKSTLLKLIEGEIATTEGMVRRHNHLKIGRYHQHLKEWLDLNLSAVEHLMNCFPDCGGEEGMRKALGQFGLSGKQQICPMRNLSEGQRCRIVFAWLSWNHPHLLLLDEPTNHLDMETIDALADAINEFPGGLILVSHDFRLINQVNCEVWVCQNGRVEKWEGDILTYKQHLQDTLKPPKKSKKKTGAKK